MNMEPEKNIQLTVVRPREDNGEMEIDLLQVWAGMKRFFALWLALAIALAAVTAGIGIGLRKTAKAGSATALIEYTTLDNKTAVDITKLQSPTVLETALKNAGVGLDQLDEIRTALTLTGVLSDEAYDQLTLYNNLLAKSNANLETVRSLLNANGQPTRYIVALDYQKAKLDRETGVKLLDEIVKSYRSFFEATYNDRAALGSAVSAISYENYDYSEAITLVTGVLNDLRDYVSGIMSQDQMAAFRSRETGFAFQDLLDAEALLRDVELNQIASFVNTNSVTAKEPATVIARYEWQIENLNWEKNVLEAKLASLTASVSAYGKDPILYSVGSNGSLVKQDTSTQKDAYDAMIQEEIDTQKRISKYNTSIRYYESIISRLKQTDRVLEANSETAKARLSVFVAKVNGLVSDVNATAAEYYEKSQQGNTLSILVPANARAPGITEGGWVKMLMILEVILFLAYGCAALFYGIGQSNLKKKETEA